MIYLRLAIRRVASLKVLARIAEITDDILHTLRTQFGIEWVKPLRKFEGMLELPDFTIQFLDAAEKAGLLAPPASPVPWALPHVARVQPQPPFPNEAPPPPAPPQ